MDLVDVAEGNIHFARFWLLRGDTVRAMGHLRAAVEVELFSDPQITLDVLLEEDPDFSSVSGSPEFKTIVKALKDRLGVE